MNDLTFPVKIRQVGLFWSAFLMTAAISAGSFYLLWRDVLAPDPFATASERASPLEAWGIFALFLSLTIVFAFGLFNAYFGKPKIIRLTEYSMIFPGPVWSSRPPLKVPYTEIERLAPFVLYGQFVLRFWHNGKERTIGAAQFKDDDFERFMRALADKRPDLLEITDDPL